MLNLVQFTLNTRNCKYGFQYLFQRNVLQLIILKLGFDDKFNLHVKTFGLIAIILIAISLIINYLYKNPIHTYSI